MDTVAQELITLFDLEHVGIALMDDNRQSLTVVTDTAREPGGESAVGIVLPVAGNLSTEKVLETLKPLVIEDAPNNPLTEPIHDLLRWRGTETLIIMPLIASGEVIGTIGMDIAEKERTFTAAEMRLAETVVAQVSASVQNVYLFEQTQRALAQTEILYRIGAELNAAQEYSEILTAVQRGGVIGKEAHYLSLALFEQPWAGAEESQTLREAARWSEKPLPVSEATQFLLSEAPLPAKF
jgi:GAF domain-containing protein